MLRMKLSTYLNDRRLPLSQFAEIVSCDRATMSRIIRGLQIPRPDLMVRIHRATGGIVAPNDFYALESQPTAHPDTPHEATAA